MSFSFMFQGEEIAIGIRGFTHGYDFYAPRDSVVFHEYAEMSNRRKHVPFFTYVAWTYFTLFQHFLINFLAFCFAVNIRTLAWVRNPSSARPL